MNFHDDGEPGFGPIVSTLSLGNVPATMSFRVKKIFVETKKFGGEIKLGSAASEGEAVNRDATMRVGAGTPRQRNEV